MPVFRGISKDLGVGLVGRDTIVLAADIGSLRDSLRS
jgi:hypothetical protein